MSYQEHEPLLAFIGLQVCLNQKNIRRSLVIGHQSQMKSDD